MGSLSRILRGLFRDLPLFEAGRRDVRQLRGTWTTNQPVCPDGGPNRVSPGLLGPGADGVPRRGDSRPTSACSDTHSGTTPGWRCPRSSPGWKNAPTSTSMPSVSSSFEPGQRGERFSSVTLRTALPFLAGEGAALAMAGAYLLARELDRAAGDHAAAFVRYEGLYRPFIERKQRVARAFASSFAPRTNFGLAVRDAAVHLMKLPLLGTWMARRMFADDFALPESAVRGEASSQEASERASAH